MTYALGAGELFDVNARNEYVDTTIGINTILLTVSIRFYWVEILYYSVLFQLNVLTIILNNVCWKLRENYHQTAKESIQDWKEL